jgi:hypothetical protein
MNPEFKELQKNLLNDEVDSRFAKSSPQTRFHAYTSNCESYNTRISGMLTGQEFERVPW